MQNSEFRCICMVPIYFNQGLSYRNNKLCTNEGFDFVEKLPHKKKKWLQNPSRINEPEEQASLISL